MSDSLQPFELTDAIARQLWPDIAFPVTWFDDVHARAGHVGEWWITPRVLVRIITEARAREKARLPLLKLARLGSTSTAKGSLRHDANVTAVTGIEADYDGEVVSFETACDTMRKHGLASIVYTSPSHTEDKPRWRVLCPFTVDGTEATGLPPPTHKQMMGRLAGVFAAAGVMFAPESWALSQAYYYGGVVNGADHAPQVAIIEGITIDRCDDLDDAAVGASPQPKRAEHQQTDKSRSAAAFRIGARLRRGGASFDEMCEAIRTDAAIADWYREKGEPNDGRELHRIWDRAGDDGEQGKRRRNTLALVSLITDQEEWQGALAANLLTETIGIALHLPSTARCERRPLVDADVLEAMLHFQARGFAKATKGMVLDALTVIAHRNAYHPIRDHLNALHWDGTERAARLFVEYFNADVPAEDNQQRDRHVTYLERVATCFMVSAVARVMDPGCKVDHVPVLVGPQGIGKSTALRALCHDAKWFSDDISPNLIDRDTKESLRGKWLVELAEMPHARKAVEQVKAFFSRCEDRYREAYGMLNRDHPRQCVFVGTTNDVEFVDPTGNRRFWPIALAGQIDVARIVAERDQLWAEAVSLYRQGEPWWLPPKFEALAAEVQDAFTEADLWEAPIGRWVEARSGGFTMEDLFAADTGFMPFREATAATKADQMRAARSLTRLGFVKRQETRNGSRAYWWQRKTQKSWE